nr:DUF4123 domain-containing protein [Luteimonas sp. BDR2-5]
MLLERLREVVFNGAARAGAAGNVFAVLDGAMVEALPERLAASDCEYACLFSGALDPVLESAAPHLVRLEPGHPFAEQVLRQGWNDHWGIVLRAAPGVDLYDLRQHLRRHLRVLDPDGQAMFFRFYDPRAFRVVIPELDSAARRGFFGPVRSFIVESARADTVLRFDHNGDAHGHGIVLAAAATA